MRLRVRVYAESLKFSVWNNSWIDKAVCEGKAKVQIERFSISSAMLALDFKQLPTLVSVLTSSPKSHCFPSSLLITNYRAQQMQLVKGLLSGEQGALPLSTFFSPGYSPPRSLLSYQANPRQIYRKNMINYNGHRDPLHRYQEERNVCFHGQLSRWTQLRDGFQQLPASLLYWVIARPTILLPTTTSPLKAAPSLLASGC